MTAKSIWYNLFVESECMITNFTHHIRYPWKKYVKKFWENNKPYSFKSNRLNPKDSKSNKLNPIVSKLTN